ncbi:hypothetical protein [Paraburkholderia strydomiana]|uniref:hypothetical protein n=1 Tax=Paraburkholderia strydomiana TaxID=1245417 RepID=UPI0038B8407D
MQSANRGESGWLIATVCDEARLQCGDAHLQSGELLAKVVMQFTSNAPWFIFACELHLRGQLVCVLEFR